MKLKKAFPRLLAVIILVMSLTLFSACKAPCEHRDADDDNKCDKCASQFTDGAEPCDEHKDADDNNKCDFGGEDFSDGCDAEHRDADDNGKCDFGGEDFSDGCDAEHKDADDNGKCDFGGEAFEDGCDAEHKDADDNGKCDFGGEDFSDGCDAEHKDADDNGKCDFGDEAFSDKCDVAPCRDADDNNKCDNCGYDFSDGCDTGHRDADDNNECDRCGNDFSDGCDAQHKDTDDNGKCDAGDEAFSDKCDVAPCRDADDNNKCDNCGYDFSDKCDVAPCRDADDNDKCDNCGYDFSDKCDVAPCRDADDNGKCDNCGFDFSDGCDAQHRDANDDGKCDAGGEAFSDKCDVAPCRDADDNNKCDNCGYDFSDKCDATACRDADDNNKCDNCGYDFSDQCDATACRDADDNGKCDNCGYDFSDGCDAQHKDTDDNGKCDFGDEAFSDKCDVNPCRDADDNNKCDNCGYDFSDKCDVAPCTDADDNNRCDKCGEKYYSNVIIANGKSKYTIVAGDKSSSKLNSTTAAVAIQSTLSSATGVSLTCEKYSASKHFDLIIVFGLVEGMEITERLVNEVNSKPDGSYSYGIAYKDGIVAVYANVSAAFNKAPKGKFDNKPLFVDLAAALTAMVTDKNLYIENGYYKVFSITESEYQALVAQDEAKYQAKLEEERLAKIQAVADRVAAFNTNDFKNDPSDTIKTNLGSGSPSATPIAQHPRILFTSADIPGIRAKIEAEKAKNSADYQTFMGYINKVDTLTGILSAPTESSSGRGYYNWDGKLLIQIQATALYYAVYGDEYYGYTAIYAMKNYLKTLDIQYITGDQCREFGMVMYIAACVYDWCYDLLTDLDKEQITLGVQHKLCSGSTPGWNGNAGAEKMEMGFPPSDQGGVVGHGSEFQLLRDYLSFAIAIYDEVPGWYTYIGGRFYKEYVPVRQLYYSAGLYPQGTSTYGVWRFVPDCYAAALITAATGTNPYTTDMMQVVFSFASYETSGGKMFQSGDGSSTSFDSRKIGYHSIILSHVFSNTEQGAVLRLMASDLISSYNEYSICNVLNPEFFIFGSREVPEISSTEWRDILPNITYNGGYVGQYIVRNTWDSNGAVVLMKIGEMTTANHDHEDAGTFQIHYKGLTTGSSGGYKDYGTAHWKYYHQATVSKNGMLVYDPSMSSKFEGYYSGSQDQGSEKKLGDWDYGSDTEPGSLKEWQNGTRVLFDTIKYNRAKVLGHASAYMADGITPQYAYIAGDLSQAYQNQASYVGRSMLTAYTGNDSVPMIFFVYDRVDASKDSFIKKFLLQVNGKNAPDVDTTKKTVTIKEGNGRLVLQNVIGCDTIEQIGGGSGKNYMVNGKQLSDSSFKDTGSWGRVELHNTSGKSSNIMLNVIYVTNSTSTLKLSVKSVSGYDASGSTKLLEGASVRGITTLFATDKTELKQAFKFTASGSGNMTYYVGGLAAGKWDIYVGGSLLTTKQIASGEGLLTFTATAGTEISISPA